MTFPAKMLGALAVLAGLLCVLFYRSMRNQKAEIAHELSGAQKFAAELDQNYRMATAEGERLRRDLSLLEAELAGEKAKASTFYQQNVQARLEIARLSQTSAAQKEQLEARERETQRLKRELINVKSAIGGCSKMPMRLTGGSPARFRLTIISASLKPGSMPSMIGAGCEAGSSRAALDSTEPASVQPAISTSAPSSSTHRRAVARTFSRVFSGDVLSTYNSLASMPKLRTETSPPAS